MSDQHTPFAAEMAAVSAVQSQELVEAAGTAGDLAQYQQSLDTAADRVLQVRETLLALKQHEVTPSLAKAMDDQLNKALEVVDQTIPVAEGASGVEGAESLGRTLMPSQYLLTRLAGCENFLSEWYRKSKEVTMHLVNLFHDNYVIFTESKASLTKQLDILEGDLNGAKEFNARGKIVLGSRSFNRLRINGKVDEKWVENISKLNHTLAALSSNYYLNNKNTMGAVFSYFGGFGKLDKEGASARLKRLPISIPSTPFKECSYPDAEHTTQTLIGKRSVELMGGAHYYDIRLKARPAIAKTVDEVDNWVASVVHHEGTFFQQGAEYTAAPNYEVNALSPAQIRAVVSALRKLLNDWSKIFVDGQKYLINDRDYLSAMRDFSEGDFDESTKTKLAKHYAQIIQHHQMELLKLRTAGSSYVSLIINAMIRVCRDSIDFGR